MKVFKKFMIVITMLVATFAFVACGGDPTTTQTTQSTQLTTEGTQQTTTSTQSTAGPGEPYFTGLFTEQTYYIGSYDYDMLAGVQAIDPEDGDITDDIQLIGGYTSARPGTYEVYVVATDSDGNVASELVTLKVKELTEYTIPETLTSEDITIELWHANGATVENALMQYATEFNALYPNVTVNIVANGPGYDTLRSNMVNAIRGGQIPNIIQNYPDHVMEYLNYNALIPLTPYITNTTWGYDPTVESESFLDILESYRRENSQYSGDGEYYSLPFNKSTEVMIYNKTMMDMLIADGTITEVPDTWQGLFDIADELSAIAPAAIDQIAANLNESSTLSVHKTPEEIAEIKANFIPITYDSPDNAFITLTRQWGGAYTAIDAQRNGVILFDNDQTEAMLSFFFDNRDTAFTVPAKWGFEYGSDAFKTGQTAITFGSTGGARYNTPTVVDGEYVFDFGVAPMPYNADMPEERTAIQQGTNMSITIAGTDQEKLASWLFIQYITSKDVQLDFALETGYSPVRYSVYDEPLYTQFLDGLDVAGNPLTGEMLMKSKAANAAALQSDFLFYDQAFVGSSDCRTEVEVAFERVILGSLEGTTKEDIIYDAIQAAKSNAERVLS